MVSEQQGEGGRKLPFHIGLANGLYNSLDYRASRDSMYNIPTIYFRFIVFYSDVFYVHAGFHPCNSDL